MIMLPTVQRESAFHVIIGRLQGVRWVSCLLTEINGKNWPVYNQM